MIELPASRNLNSSKLTRTDDQKSDLNENTAMIESRFGPEHRLMVIFEVPLSTFMLSIYPKPLQL
jgi:hypothetical protein